MLLALALLAPCPRDRPAKARPVCGRAPRRTGTHMRHKRCRTVGEWQADRDALDRSRAPALLITGGQDAGKDRPN